MSKGDWVMTERTISGRPPNLLLVFPDQMRAEAMGCTGNLDVRTPCLDALAAEGTRFGCAIANCPVCTPSRGTMLTGRYPLSHRALANDLPLPEDERTMGDILSKAGWSTGYIGKWHLDGVPRDRFTPPGPRRHGFDYWAAWNCAHAYFRGRYHRDAPEPLDIQGYEPDGQTDLALDFIRARQHEPWALVLSWGPPHDPYAQVPAADRALYDPEALTPRANAPDADRRALADYYAAVTALDRNVGRLCALLAELDLAASTLMVFTSDHGDMLFSHGMRGKQRPYDESIRVPLIFRYPGVVPAGRLAPDLFTLADLLPTVLGLMDVSPPDGVQGQDLSALVRGGEAPSPSSAFLLHPVPVDAGADPVRAEWRGVRTARYTYAARLAGPWVLYDNVADPLQERNLVGESAYATVRRELEMELESWLRRTSDPFRAWQEHIRELGLTELWNSRERVMHPARPQLVGF